MSPLFLRLVVCVIILLQLTSGAGDDELTSSAGEDDCEDIKSVMRDLSILDELKTQLSEVEAAIDELKENCQNESATGESKQTEMCSIKMH